MNRKNEQENGEKEIRSKDFFFIANFVKKQQSAHIFFHKYMGYARNYQKKTKDFQGRQKNILCFSYFQIAIITMQQFKNIIGR